MWTEEKIREAAAQYLIQQMQYYNMPMIQYDGCSGEFDSNDIKNAFIAGAKFIINNTQKETEK